MSAIRMALALRKVVGAFVIDWKRRGHELGFSVGVAIRNGLERK